MIRFQNFKKYYIVVFILLLSVSCSNPSNKTRKEEPLPTKKENLLVLSNSLLTNLNSGDFSAFVNLVHPIKGVRFSPYGHVNINETPVFSANELNNYFIRPDSLFFGFDDGTGDSIRLDLRTYIKDYILTPNYLKSTEISINQVHKTGNAPMNMADAFPNSDFIEYYFSGFDKQYDGMDWKALRLVWENYNNKWYLVGIVRACWTI